jgi:6-phosphogluconolactonase
VIAFAWLAATACNSHSAGDSATSGGSGSGARAGSLNGGSPNVSGAGGGANGLGGSGATSGNGSGGTAGSSTDAGAGGAAAGSGGASGAAGTSGTAGTAGSAGTPAFTGDPMVYVGGYDPNVRSYRLNRMSGALTEMGGPTNLGNNPAYLAVDPSRTHLYAGNETDGAQGGVTAATIGANGALTSLGKQAAENLGFVHVAVDPTGRFVVGASYNGGAVAVFPIGATGALGAAVDVEHFTGNPIQSHCSAFDRAGTHVFVPNKGLDGIAQFSFDPQSGALTAQSPASVASANGAGPRHIAVHPSGAYAYVINELDSTMTAYRIQTNGTLASIETEPTLPTGFSGQNTGAHVEVSPDGTLVFGSNRGHDSIVVFSIDAGTGALTLVEHEPSRGTTPRDFDVDPAGQYLIVANQGSDNLAVFRIASSGLTPVGNVVTGANNPAAVQFVYLP